MHRRDFNPSLNNHVPFTLRTFLGLLRIKLVQMKFESSTLLQPTWLDAH